MIDSRASPKAEQLPGGKPRHAAAALVLWASAAAAATAAAATPAAVAAPGTLSYQQLEHCAAGLDLTITTVDAAVHVRQRRRAVAARAGRARDLVGDCWHAFRAARNSEQYRALVHRLWFTRCSSRYHDLARVVTD